MPGTQPPESSAAATETPDEPVVSHRSAMKLAGLGLGTVAAVGVGVGVTPAYLGFTMTGHILARAVLTVTAEIPA
ncbi:hypothetical protein ACQ86D_01805 [Streptomyces galilaeus]